MQWDAKDRKILNFILEVRAWENTNWLCDKLELSRSNLNYHLSHINSVFMKNKIRPINLKDRKLEDFDHSNNFYSDFVYNYSNLFLNSNERRLVLVILLLFNEKMSLKFLSEILDVSSNSIFNDIQFLKNSDWILKNGIKFNIDKNGYSIEGGSIELHKLLINSILQISAIDLNQNILQLLLNNLHFDDYNFLKTNEISNTDFYNYISSVVGEVYSKTELLNINKKTLNLIIFFLFTRKFHKGLQKEDLEYYNVKKNEFQNSKWWELSTQVINKIKSNYNLQNYDIGHFEKLYIGQLLFSNFDSNSFTSDKNLIDVKNKYKELVNYLELKGYRIDQNLNLMVFINFYKYFDSIPFKKLLDGQWLTDKQSYFTNSTSLSRYLLDFKRAFIKTNFMDFKNNKFGFLGLASSFLLGVTHIPNENESRISKSVILVTDLTDISLNIWIYKVLKKFRIIEDFKVISCDFYLENPINFKNFSLISNNKTLNKQLITIVPND